MIVWKKNANWNSRHISVFNIRHKQLSEPCHIFYYQIYLITFYKKNVKWNNYLKLTIQINLKRREVSNSFYYKEFKTVTISKDNNCFVCLNLSLR